MDKNLDALLILQFQAFKKSQIMTA